MPDVEWSPEVERAIFRLPPRSRALVLRAVATLRAFPESGRPIESGRFRGCRAVPIRPHWALYYRVIDADRTCRLTSLRDARRRPV